MRHAKRLWRDWTDPDQMKLWWGSKGFRVLFSKTDLRPGGIYHYGMEAPDDSTMWGKFTFLEVAKPERLVFINSPIPVSEFLNGIARSFSD